jgi:hypothetical protein
MVDFNNETTIGTPAPEVQKILILQRRNDLIDSLEAYEKIVRQNSSINTGTFIVASRAKALFYEIQAILKRSSTEEEYERLLSMLSSEDFPYLEEAYYTMNQFLDEKRIIRIDTKRQYDTSRVDQEDKSNEL